MRTLILSRPDRVGDVVISTSCLTSIREKYHKIYFVAAERMRPLLEGHPLLAGFIPLSLDLTAEFQRLNASAIVHLHPDENCYVAAAQAGLPVRIGYPARLLSRHLTHKVEERRKAGLMHEAEYNFDLLRVLDITPPKTLSTNVHLNEASRISLQNKIDAQSNKPLAVLHPAAHSKVARWPAGRFLQLADRLEKKFGLLPVFVGADANDLPPVGTSHHLNLMGKTDLGELAWLLKRATVLVTNDSGPAHLAAAVGCPVVAIFGRTAPMYGPVRWRPLSERAVVVSKPLTKKLFERRHAHWQRCFAAIELGDVEAAVRRTLECDGLQPQNRQSYSSSAGE